MKDTDVAVQALHWEGLDSRLSGGGMVRCPVALQLACAVRALVLPWRKSCQACI